MAFKRILIPIANDEQTLAQEAIRSGFLLAQQLKASLILAHIKHTHQLLEDSVVQTESSALLEPWVQLGQQVGVTTQTCVLQSADIAMGICTIAKDEAADLIYMPTHAREGMNRILLGSVAERVTRFSMIPVMLMRLQGQRYPLRFEHVIVPVDGSEPSTIAIQQATALAMALQARVTLLHIIQDELSYVTAFNTALHNTTAEKIQAIMEQEATIILEQARKIAEPYPVALKAVHHQNQGVAYSINEEVQQLHGDLIVIGTHGLRGVQRLLLSSVAEAVAHHAPVSVMLVSSAQKAELWQPSVLGKLAKEVTAERERKKQHLPIKQ